MSKHNEYSIIFVIFYDNFRRWCREMAVSGELSDQPEEQFYDFFLKNFMYSLFENDELRIFVNHGQEQFHLSSLDSENKKSIVYIDEEINQIAHFAINLIAMEWLRLWSRAYA